MVYVSVAIYSYVSSVSDHIVSNILEDDAWTDKYIISNRLELSKAYSHCIYFLRKHAITYAPGANAAFFLWVDLGTAYLARHPARGQTDIEGLTEEIPQGLLKQKLYLASGAVFGSEKAGVFRIVFLHPREYLEEGFRRMMNALEGGTTEEEEDLTNMRLCFELSKQSRLTSVCASIQAVDGMVLACIKTDRLKYCTIVPWNFASMSGDGNWMIEQQNSSCYTHQS